MFDYTEKQLFANGCFPPEKPDKRHFTVQEDMQHATRQMRETIARMLRFEERTRKEFEDLMRQMTSDNVLFKTTMNEAHTLFLQEVKNEVNMFEANVSATISLFQKDIETNYATLSDDVRTVVSENLASMVADFEAFKTAREQAFTELSNSLNEQYTAFAENVNTRIDNNNQTHSQAMADYQRHLTTELNTYEQTMTASFDNFVSGINTTIETFRDTWETVITERLNEQDAKLSDAEMYMKTNLTATATTLIGDMADNGDFAEILEGELFNNLENKTRRDFCTATFFESLPSVVEFCKVHNRIFYVPYGETLDIDEALDLTGLDVAIYGEVNVTHHGVGLIVGGNSHTGDIRNIYIRNVKHASYSNGDISVRCVGLMRGKVEIERADVIQLYADGDIDEIHSIGYSSFDIGTCRKLILIDKEGADGLGWINENIFNINRVTEELLIEGHTFSHDNNVFLKPCLEGAKLTLKKCCRNKFYDVRSEGNFSASFDENSKYNYVLNNFHWGSVQLQSAVVDNGIDNIFTNSIYEAMEYLPFYIINEKTVNGDKYEISFPDRFSASNGKVTPTQQYAKLLNDVIVPVDKISFVGMESDKGTFQLYVTPLDANKNAIKTKPLDYTGGIIQNASGTYQPSTEVSKVFIEILDPSVKYLKLTLDTAISSVKPFENLVLYALAKKHNATSLHILGEYLKK